MKPLVTAEGAAALDASTRANLGMSDDVLMESAAAGLCDALARALAADGTRASTGTAGPAIAALCGKGNNGGDALAMLRREAFIGRRGLVAIVDPEPGPVAARRLLEARAAGVAVLDVGDTRAGDAARDASVLLDGIAGTGCRGPLRGASARLAALATGARGRVVAIDLPSGVGPFDPGYDGGAVRADCTLTIAPAKAELYFPGHRARAGAIVEVPGVFPAGSSDPGLFGLLEASDLDALLPVLPPDAHKGIRGSLGLYAGAIGTTGAAVLAARAGSAAGAGTVTLVTPDDAWQVAAAQLVSQMVRPESIGSSRAFDAVVAGPGWGRGERQAERLTGLWESDLPLVLDADALRLLSQAGRTVKPRAIPAILTPHPGESLAMATEALRDNAGDSELDETTVSFRIQYDTATVLRTAAQRYGSFIVLKGAVTWLAHPDGRVAIWDGMRPSLATGGSGDVLAGLAGGFLARGIDPWDAARAAVAVHGMAGGLAEAERGFYDAESLVDCAARVAFRGGLHGNEG